MYCLKKSVIFILTDGVKAIYLPEYVLVLCIISDNKC